MVVAKEEKLSLPSKDALHLVQNSKANKAAPALARSIFLLKDFKGNTVNNVCLVQYHVSNGDGRVEDLQIQKHGNSRSTNPGPFYPGTLSHSRRARSRQEEIM